MKPTVSSAYNLDFLSMHPDTKDILSKHLHFLGPDLEDGSQRLSATLHELRDTNMGGGLPYDVLMALIDDLDEVGYPLEETTTG